MILADTIKGWGYPFGGDPMNHSALLTQGQLDEMRAALGIAAGEEWAGFAPGSAEAAPDPPRRPRRTRRRRPGPTRRSTSPTRWTNPIPPQSSTQEAFGRILGRLSRLPVGDRVVTFSADVSVTTHLAGWINRKGVYFPRAKPGFTAEGPQAVQWKESPAGQHIELGIAEHNLFLALGAFGLTARAVRARRSCRSARSTIPSSRAGSTRSTTRSTRAGASSWPPRRRG